jgi:O-antigen/teichoic acid export membrane protein
MKFLINNLLTLDFQAIPHKKHLSIFYSVVIHFTVMLLGAIGSIFIMRMIGPYEWGIFCWMIAICSIASVLTVSGSGNASRIFTAQNTHLTEPIIIVRLLAIFTTAPIVFLTMYAFTRDLEIAAEHPYAYTLALMIFPILTLNNLASDLLIIKGRGLHVSNIFAFEKLAYTITALVAVILFDISADYLFIIFCICALLRLFCSLFYIRSYIHKWPALHELSETFRLGRWLGMNSYINGLCFCFMSMGPTILLGYLSYDYNLKHFAVAKSIADFAMLIPVLIAGYALPPLIKDFSEKTGGVSETKIVVMACIFMLALIIPFASFPEFILYIALGTGMDVVVDCIRIMTIGIFSYGVMAIIQPLVVAQKPNDKWTMISPLVAAMSMCLLILFHTKEESAVTMAYIFSGTYAVYFISFVAMYLWKKSK